MLLSEAAAHNQICVSSSLAYMSPHGPTHVHLGPYIDAVLQVNEKICNLGREYRDCIKSRRDKIRITRHIMMHQELYNVHVTLFIGQLHNI